MKQVSDAVRMQVLNQIAACIDVIEQQYAVKLKRPKVLFSRRGTIAAVANSTNWLIDFNPVLLNENFDRFLADTVPHEVAHLATDVIYPEPPVNGRRDVHGSKWQEIMQLLGAPLNRCHTYDVTHSRIERAITRHQYECDACKKAINVGAKRHSTLQADPRAFWHTVCGRDSTLTYIGSTTEQPRRLLN